MMDDLISRQAVMDLLARTAGVGNRALDKIRLLPSVPGIRWISVTEVLPEELLPVLVAVREKDRKAAWATEKSWHYVTAISALDGGAWDYYGDQVAAWMPLPEPYKEMNDTGKEQK